ncbi:MAG: PHP domain-containing protein [Candidatus Hydrogenedentes bacterium]|nr:PHP domain-containing protein [Candidatus Hydrogenedentota bacterium]
MTPRYADLHLHTNFSDGTDSPRRVVERAAAAGIAAMAITDHDTIEGVAAARGAAEEAGIAFLTGTEISARFDHIDLHILGLGIRVDSPPLVAALNIMKDARAARAQRMIERLAARGISISLEPDAHKGVIGRMHLARALQSAGHAKTVQQAFDKYLQRGKPGYVAQVKMECIEAIGLIHAAGGLAFIAHPGIGAPRHKLQSLLELPFDGVEAYHSKHSPGLTDMIVQLARDRNLLVTGGSDCHGEAKGRAEMGRVHLPMECFERISESLQAGSLA